LKDPDTGEVLLPPPNLFVRKKSSLSVK
jgi:hypothetical protein